MNNIICCNCVKIFLNRLREMDIHIKNNIFDYIQPIHLVCLNKGYYEKYHYLITDSISSRDFTSYIRFIIRNDHAFTFHCLINEKNDKLKQNKKKSITFHNKSFKNVYDYMTFLCKNYESENCKNLLINYRQNN